MGLFHLPLEEQSSSENPTRDACVQAEFTARFPVPSEVSLNEVQKVAESRGEGEKSSSVHTHTMETLVSNINKRWVVTPKLFFDSQWLQ